MAKKAKKAKKTNPSTHGRDGKGKFTKGNTSGTGSTNHKAIKQSKHLKAAFAAAVTDKDIKAICKGLIRKAKKGDVPAAKELFDRLWGKAMQSHEVELDAGEKLQAFMDWLIDRNDDSA